MKSMTGFGRSICQNKGMSLETVIRTLNNRYFVLKVRLPPELTQFEPQIRKIIQQNISRGTVELSMKLEYPLTDFSRLNLDHGLAREYIYNLKKLSSTIDIPGTEIDKTIKLESLLNIPDIWTVKSPELINEDLMELITDSLKQTLNMVLDMRTDEGSMLQQLLLGMFESIKQEIPEIEIRAAQHHDLVYDSLLKRIEEKCSQIPRDKARLEEEILYYCEKSNITEEIHRLKIHLDNAIKLCHEKSPLGRKTEFLIQEMFREVNTLGVKASSAEISSSVVIIKTQLDKLKEQIQNIE